MRKLTLLGAAAILASAAALPSLAQAASCAQFDPNCATYPMPKSASTNSNMTDPNMARADANRPRHVRYERHRADRTMRREAMNDRQYNDRDRSGFWPGDVAAGAVDTGLGIAAGAVNTAGAIATAPFRTADSYAYYNGGYNGWDNQSYAERNGFVCTPGTWFKGPDGRPHPCQ